jgi:hypothetical protein
VWTCSVSWGVYTVFIYAKLIVICAAPGQNVLGISYTNNKVHVKWFSSHYVLLTSSGM